MQDRMMQEVREDLAHIEERLDQHRKRGSALMSQPDQDERRRKRKAQRAARRNQPTTDASASERDNQ